VERCSLDVDGPAQSSSPGAESVHRECVGGDGWEPVQRVLPAHIQARCNFSRPFVCFLCCMWGLCRRNEERDAGGGSPFRKKKIDFIH